MPESNKTEQQKQGAGISRRNFLYSAFGGIIAAVVGWFAGTFPVKDSMETQAADLNAAEGRLSALEGAVADLVQEPPGSSGFENLAVLEGERGQRVIFNKSELSIINPGGVLLNLVATHGHVGIRFYKDFYFENEQETHPWHFGYIEGVNGYEGLAILRDWAFTAALWDADGKLTVGSLDSHPPANDPAKARFDVRGTLDELQTMVEASPTQTADIFLVADSSGNGYLTVDGKGNLIIGSSAAPKDVILHDTADGSAYTLQVTNGKLVLTKM